MDSTNTLTAFEPANLDQAVKVAEMISKSGLVPSALRGKPTDILLVLWKGRELGLSAMQALASINIIEGKTSLSGELIVAQCLKHSEVCEHFTLDHSDTTKATYSTKRRGSPKTVSLTYSIEDAQRAKLAHKDNWQRMPATMLRWRAASALAKAVYPELTLGMYTPDEADEIRAGNGNGATPPAPREVNEPPRSKTDAVKEKLRAKVQVVDVAPGEDEGAAERRAATPHPWDQISAYAKDLGFTDARQVFAVVSGATAKTDWKALTEADIAPAKDALKFRAGLNTSADADHAASPL